VPVREANLEATDGDDLGVGVCVVLRARARGVWHRISKRRKGATEEGKKRHASYLVKVALDHMDVVGDRLEEIKRVAVDEVARAQDVLDLSGDLVFWGIAFCGFWVR